MYLIKTSSFIAMFVAVEKLSPLRCPLVDVLTVTLFEMELSLFVCKGRIKECYELIKEQITVLWSSPASGLNSQGERITPYTRNIHAAVREQGRKLHTVKVPKTQAKQERKGKITP